MNENNPKIVCKTCKKEFYLQPKEVAFYEKHNLALPKHCRRCRQKRKAKAESKGE